MKLYRVLIKVLNAVLGTCAMTLCSNAQTLSQEVIGTAGNEMLTPGISLSYTIGEPCVSYWNTSGNILTEGFQQNDWVITSVAKTEMSVDVNIYPNPFTNSFTIDFNNNQNDFTLHITDALGRTVDVEKNYIGNKCVIDMRSTTAGIYFLTIFNNHQTVSVYRLVKSNL